MVNGLGVLGWGVGGIEAEAAMLGQPVSMLIPRVVGFKLTGELPDGATATDLVLTITEMLREHGVVGKFVEFYGAGVSAVPLANRATIGNMSPEFGSTAAMFPIDEETITYLELTGRSKEQVALVEAYAKEQGLWHDASREPAFSEYLELDLATIVPSIAGPKRPQDRVAITDAKQAFREALPTYAPDGDSDPDDAARARAPASTSRSRRASRPPTRPARSRTATARPASRTTPSPATAAAERTSKPTRVVMEDGTETEVDHGHVVIAAITSCTNTSNPQVMIGAALLAKNAVERGPDQQAVGEDDAGPRVQGRHGLLREGRAHPVPGEARLLPGRLRLHDLHRQLRPAARAGVGRGQRGRPRRRLGALGQPQLRGPDQPRRQDELPGVSPPLVIAYALAGSMDVDLNNDPLGQDPDGNDVFLHDIWPSPQEVQRVIDHAVSAEMFSKDYADVFAGTEQWQSLPTPERRHVRLGRAEHLRAQAPVLRRDAGRAVPGRGHRRRPHPGGARRLGDHRPHLAGRLDQGRLPRRASTCASTAWTVATSTPTAPAAGTTRS